MKKAVCILIILFIFVCVSAFAGDLFSVGGGFSFMPGTYDYQLLVLYDKQLNNDNISNLDLSEIKPVHYLGFHIFGQLNWKFLMVRLAALLQIPNRIEYSYIDDSSGATVPYNVEHKSLFINSTLWFGPRLNITDTGAVYACLGPSVLYGEWRDKVDSEDNPGDSKDRQYTGMGFVLPLLIGVEVKISELIGVALEGIIFNQQIVIKTFSLADFDETESVNHSLPFPFCSNFLPFPYPYWVQLAVIFHL